MKAEGREKEIQKELKKLKNLKQTSIPKLSLMSPENCLSSISTT